MRAALGSRRRIESASVLLPEPDSPTMPRVSPARSTSETSSTARTTRVPRALTKCVESCLISRSGALTRSPAESMPWPGRRSELAELGIQLHAQPVAQQVGGQDHQHDAAAREHGEPPVTGHQSL